MQLKNFLEQVSFQLRYYREIRDLNQSELAALLCIGARSYQRYEAGDSVPPLDLIYKVSRILKVQMDYFVFPENHLSQFPNVQFYFSPLPPSSDSEGYYELTELSKIRQEIYRSGLEKGFFETIKSNHLFLSSKLEIALSDHKTSLLNPSAKEAHGFESHSIPTRILSYDSLSMGLIWGSVLKTRPTYFTCRPVINTPRGNHELQFYNVLLEHHGQWAILRHFRKI